MAHSQFSLLWDSHKKNICSGLSSLQQNGEFVDMTLAADGHMVKVHQVIIALASPYLKELISSAQCPHPVILLNKISYTTLCSILEYIYTGEVLVSIENLNELILAGQELHINGLQDMKLRDVFTTTTQGEEAEVETDFNIEALDDEICYFEIPEAKGEGNKITEVVNETPKILETPTDDTFEECNEDKMMEETNDSMIENSNSNTTSDNANVCAMQYTVSNQGSLQMILNRYIYYLKHANRNNTRQWRCVDYLKSIKCPAHVFTENDYVVKRISAHIHPFHDRKILKKVRAGAVFAAISEAQQKGKNFAKALMNNSE